MVVSLARPGGNVTGFTGAFADLMSKRLELLKDVIPGLSRVAILSNPTNPAHAEYIRQTELAAPVVGVQLQIVEIRDAVDFDRAFKEARGASAALQLDDVAFISHRRELVDLAARNRLPVVYGFREFVDVGGFISYGPSFPDQYRRAATYIDKILKGAKPGDLPVQMPTKIELIVNLQAARTLAVEIPPSLLANADEVIE
jgi:putative tryptophan/tyrosine transport system substrate-binding protein